MFDSIIKILKRRAEELKNFNHIQFLPTEQSRRKFAAAEIEKLIIDINYLKDVVAPPKPIELEPKCKICKDAGWVWRKELPDLSDWDGSADDTRYDCPYCAEENEDK